MSRFSLTHLSDVALLRDLAALVATDRATTATLIAHLAEVDRRRLYARQDCDSLFDYCVRVLKFSEDAAAQRIRAARAARRFPAIFAMVADGRLHLSAVRLLAPKLTRANAPGLLAAATHKTRRQVEKLIAERFPRPDLPTVIQPVRTLPAPLLAPGSPSPAPRTPGIADDFATRTGNTLPASELSPRNGLEQVPGPVESGNPLPASALDEKSVQATGPVGPQVAWPAYARVTHLAPDHIGIQVTVPQATHDKLTRASELLAHAVPGGDVAQVLDRALEALIEKLERRKFGATDRPRKTPPAPPGSRRTIPAAIRRAVAKRDGRCCTYVGSGGVRCESRRFLEYDHVIPLAHGGETTVKNLRLRCRAHNQLEADKEFGSEFMQQKREHARERSNTTAT